MTVSPAKSRRGRPEKACQSCQLRKIKCERTHSTAKCKTCHDRGTECKVENVKNRKNRVGNLNISSSSRRQNRRLHHDIPSTTSTSTSRKPAYNLNVPPLPETTRIPDTAQSLSDSYGQGEMSLAFLPCFTLPRFFVGSTGVQKKLPYSLFSPEGAEWVAAKAPPDALEPLDTPCIDMPVPSDDRNLNFDWNQFATHVPVEIQPYISLPPLNFARNLFKIFFHTLNRFCEVFDEKEFMNRFERDYPPDYQRSPSWWGCVNAALALGHTLEDRFNPTAWLFWKNASLSLNNLFTGPPRLLSVQALLSMALFQMATFHGQLLNTIVPLAIRTLQGLELPEGQTSPVHRRLRSIALAIDIDRSLHLGIPPSQIFDPEPCTIEHGKEFTGNSTFHAPGTHYTGFNIYNSFNGLTAIKNEIYRQLYSVKGQDKSDTDVIATVSNLDSSLQDWTKSMPQEFVPGTVAAEDLVREDVHLSICYLHFSYYNCLLSLHRRAVTRATWSMYLDPCQRHTEESFCPNNTRPFISRQVCATAARASIELALCIPKSHPLCLGFQKFTDIDLNRTVIYFVMFAVMILAILIIQDPDTAQCRGDIELMKRVEESLAEISSTQYDEGVVQLIQNCFQYREIAEQEILKSLSMRK